jgi:hypothetical protein
MTARGSALPCVTGGCGGTSVEPGMTCCAKRARPYDAQYAGRPCLASWMETAKRDHWGCLPICSLSGIASPRSSPVSHVWMDQALAIAREIEDLPGRHRWDEAGAKQPALEQLGNPLGDFHVGLVAGNLLHACGVHKKRIKFFFGGTIATLRPSASRRCLRTLASSLPPWPQGPSATRPGRCPMR